MIRVVARDNGKPTSRYQKQLSDFNGEEYRHAPPLFYRENSLNLYEFDSQLPAAGVFITSLIVFT